MPILSSLYRSTATKPSFDVVFLFLVLTFEFIMSVAIVRYVPYTEIDWKAYMQEVEAWLGGETNYMNIRGDTGPLVYPAGFVYLFAWLRWFTEDGHNIQKAQFIFIVLYCFNQFIVLLIYQKMIPILRKRYTTPDQQMKQAHAVWTWRVAMVMTCLSKRIHSIFLLRLFNDGPTMLLLYLSVLLFMHQRWNLGCIVFSLGVSIKMNVLLFAPGLLLLLLQASPDFQTVVWRLGLGCALPQLILGWPFLSTYPVSYLRKAFELDRVFFYKWTVNWKFLSEEIFLAKSLSIALLLCHLGGLTILTIRWLRATKNETSKRIFLNAPLSSHYIAYTMFVSNFVGIAFARTLHYQFYAWYFASLPYLLWSSSMNNSILTWAFRLLPLVAVEVAFLTFPATPWSSAILQFSHLIVLLTIHPPPQILETSYETGTKVKSMKFL